MLTKEEIQKRLPRLVVYELYPLSDLRFTRLRHVQSAMNDLSLCKCVTCGLKGEFIIKNRQIGEVAKDQYLKQKHGYHYDAYGSLPDGTLRALTLDHILPESKGGANRDTNYQIMCSYCNHVVKSNRMTSEDWAPIMKHPELYVGTTPAKRRKFLVAAYRDLGIDILKMIQRQQDVLEATGQLKTKPYWNKLFPSTLMEPVNDSQPVSDGNCFAPRPARIRPAKA